MEFSAELELTGKTSTGFRVPPQVVEALGGGSRPPVTVTINGFTYRNTVAPMRGEYWLGVSAENRAGAGVAAGEVLDIHLELDTAPRVVEVPDDFAAALAADPAAKSQWDKLSYSHQRRHVLAAEAAKTEATRQRRIDSSIATLRADAGADGA